MLRHHVIRARQSLERSLYLNSLVHEISFGVGTGSQKEQQNMRLMSFRIVTKHALLLILLSIALTPC